MTGDEKAHNWFHCCSCGHVGENSELLPDDGPNLHPCGKDQCPECGAKNCICCCLTWDEAMDREDCQEGHSSVDLKAYSYCEPVQAGPGRRWCLRRLTKVGRKPGGGVDSTSLCGRVQPPHGWDIEAAVAEDNLDTCCCEACLQRLRAGSSAEPLEEQP